MTARQGFWAVLLSSFCFGFLGYFGKVGYGLGYTPLRLLTVRFVLASLMLWGFAAVKFKQRSKNKDQIEKTFEQSGYRISLNNVKWLALQGLAYALTALGFFNALRNMPAGLVGVLFYVHPLLTILMASLIWRETVTKVVIQSAVLAVVGAALVSQSGGAASAAGNMAGLMWIGVASFAYSAFTLIGQKTTTGLDSLVVTTYSITFCALFLVLLNPPLYMLNGTLSPNMWAVGLGISFVSSVLAILLYV
ncbi:MAG: DMT family transporter, partial [Bacillota bacterium]|nr:DMT family transporter [Bacillota bacterium]